MDFNMCVLMDFENIAAGCEKEGHGRFDTRAVMTRLKEKGRILIARSYGDWGRFAKYKQDMLEQAVQAMELTSYRGQEKNRADIALAVDAMELAYSRHYIDTFVLLSGDSDFTPLVLRLRELNKRVVGIGTRRSSSRLLVESCDEFIFYESIKRGRVAPAPVPVAAATPDVVETLAKDDALALLVETMEGLQKDEPGPMLAGRVKQSLLRKLPTFDETEYGYSGFARFLEAAQERGLVLLSTDEKAGGYRVDMPTDTKLVPDEEEVAEVEATPLLQGEPERLRSLLADLGVDPLDALRRHVVVHEFCDHVAERNRKKKRNTLIYTVGDVARRTRHSDPPVRGVQVRSVLQAIFDAGELLHADGKPIRKESAPFILRHDAEDMLRVLRGYYVARLLHAGESLGDSRALSTLLWGDQDHLTQAEELVAWMQHDRSEASAAPAEEPPAEAEEGESEDEGEEASDSGGRRRRSRRRGNRRRREGGADSEASAAPTEEADEVATEAEPTGIVLVDEAGVEEAPVAEVPAELLPEEEPAAAEPAAEEPAPAEAESSRRRTLRRKAAPKAAAAPAEEPAAAEAAPAKKRVTRTRKPRKSETEQG